MTTAALILAAGRGSRVGGDLPKQWCDLGGRSVAHRCLETFAGVAEIEMCLVVVHPDDHDLARRDLGEVELVEGGATRDASARAGLEALAGRGVTKVLIHDIARPLVSAGIISRVIAALETAPAAAPAIPVTDALWRGADGHVTGIQDRAGLYRAQTPQGFHFEAILAAHHAHRGAAADDVEIARAAGLEVAIVPGEERNLKITRQEDFGRAIKMLEGDMDVRVGNGYDVHRFGPGDSVILCGVPVAHTRGLQGHSDADVGLHAITDAIYGALGAGDIGQHFPPTDAEWEAADSATFLRHAVKLAEERGFQVAHLDCTLVCELPKIAPHAIEMKEKIAETTGLTVDRVSVKATTSERLGFTGREEGIAAQATATLLRR